MERLPVRLIFSLLRPVSRNSGAGTFSSTHMTQPIQISLTLAPAADLPDDEITVLGWTQDGGCPVYHSEDTWYASDNDQPVLVDYWCDFPELPETK